jgi:hypothetical protein
LEHGNGKDGKGCLSSIFRWSFSSILGFGMAGHRAVLLPAIFRWKLFPVSNMHPIFMHPISVLWMRLLSQVSVFPDRRKHRRIGGDSNLTKSSSGDSWTSS